MATTSLYVELIIIGLETMIWIASFSIWITDIKYISVIKEVIEKLPASIFMLGILYILGLVFDRVADIVFSKVEKQMRTSSGLKARSSILIWKKSEQEEYFSFTRSKIRILRASSINIPLFTVSMVFNISKYYDGNVFFILFVVTIGMMLSCFSYKGYKQTTKRFYDMARILEMELTKSGESQ